MAWGILSDMFLNDTGPTLSIDLMPSTVFNSATGLPMLDGSFGGVDVGGSPYGLDIHTSPSSSSGGFGPNPWD